MPILRDRDGRQIFALWECHVVADYDYDSSGVCTVCDGRRQTLVYLRDEEAGFFRFVGQRVSTHDIRIMGHQGAPQARLVDLADVILLKSNLPIFEIQSSDVHRAIRYCDL